MAKEWANKYRYHPSQVCLSLVCHCPRERVLCVRFRLGEKRVLWEEEVLLEE
jgi:hypothetical protein